MGSLSSAYLRKQHLLLPHQSLNPISVSNTWLGLPLPLSRRGRSRDCRHRIYHTQFWLYYIRSAATRRVSGASSLIPFSNPLPKHHIQSLTIKSFYFSWRAPRHSTAGIGKNALATTNCSTSTFSALMGSQFFYSRIY